MYFHISIIIEILKRAWFVAPRLSAASYLLETMGDED
jgi:hypothetical protein